MTSVGAAYFPRRDFSWNFGGLCCNRRRRPVSGTERSRSGVSSLGRLLSTRRPSLIRCQTSSPALPAANMSTLRTREIIRTWKPMVTVDPNRFALLSKWMPGILDRPKLNAIGERIKINDPQFNENLPMVFVAGFTAHEIARYSGSVSCYNEMNSFSSNYWIDQ